MLILLILVLFIMLPIVLPRLVKGLFGLTR